MQGDPQWIPEFYEAVRYEVLAAGAVDHAHVLTWRGRLHDLRTNLGRHPDESVSTQEQHALRDLLGTADVFLWLPGVMDPVGCSAGYSEAVLANWPGRGLHFHWFNDWYLAPTDPLQRALAEAMERAILDLDYESHAATQQRLLAAVRGKLLHMTTPEGTNVRMQLQGDGWYHVNDGRVTPEKQRAASCARDREEELPCGAVRTIPVIESVHGVVRYRTAGRAFGSVGYRLKEYAEDMTIEIQQGKIVRTSAGARDASWQTFWGRQTGSSNEVTELVFGTNPFLMEIPGVPMLPYWGFGEGYVRLHTGSNTESGGDRVGSLSLELWLRDATVTADGHEVIVKGRLVV